jgi:hypothetical protein
MKMRTLSAITLAASLALTSGCATITDPTTGEKKQELTPGGKAVLGLVVAGVAIAGLAALGGLDDNDPTSSSITTLSDGRQIRTDYYSR